MLFSTFGLPMWDYGLLHQMCSIYWISVLPNQLLAGMIYLPVEEVADALEEADAVAVAPEEQVLPP